MYTSISHPIRYGTPPKRSQVTKLKNCSAAVNSGFDSGETYDGEMDSITTAPVHISKTAIANRQTVFPAMSVERADLTCVPRSVEGKSRESMSAEFSRWLKTVPCSADLCFCRAFSRRSRRDWGDKSRPVFIGGSSDLFFCSAVGFFGDTTGFLDGTIEGVGWPDSTASDNSSLSCSAADGFFGAKRSSDGPSSPKLGSISILGFSIGSLNFNSSSSEIPVVWSLV